MTREDAVKVLNALWKYKNCGFSEQKIREALNMAIKALEQESVLDKIEEEIKEIEINGHIRDVECFSAGINAALKIIDKYGAESEEKE